MALDNKECEESEPLAPNNKNSNGHSNCNNVSNKTVAIPNGHKDISEGNKVVILNVGGQRHEATKKNFDKFPGSRLWKVMRATTLEEILFQCDRYRVATINDDVPEFFFDRNYTGFINILDSYRTGHLHLNANNCAVITRDDLAYWGIDELLIEPCCAVRYYPEIEICQNEIDMEEDEERKAMEREKLEDFGSSQLGKLRKTLWNLFEYPHTSRGAQVGLPF